jgi:hypothetical protein
MRLTMTLLLAMIAATAPASTSPAVYGWDFLGEGMRPATLSDCDRDDSIAVSMSVGIEAPWRRFCYGRSLGDRGAQR